jgi:hypothetical protein
VTGASEGDFVGEIRMGCSEGFDEIKVGLKDAGN